METGVVIDQEQAHATKREDGNEYTYMMREDDIEGLPVIATSKVHEVKIVPDEGNDTATESANGLGNKKREGKERVYIQEEQHSIGSSLVESSMDPPPTNIKEEMIQKESGEKDEPETYAEQEKEEEEEAETIRTVVSSEEVKLEKKDEESVELSSEAENLDRDHKEDWLAEEMFASLPSKEKAEAKRSTDDVTLLQEEPKKLIDEFKESESANEDNINAKQILGEEVTNEETHSAVSLNVESSNKQAPCYELAETASDAVLIQEANGEDHVTEKNEIQEEVSNAAEIEETILRKEQQHGDSEPSKSNEESKMIAMDEPKKDEDMTQVDTEAADGDLGIKTSVEQIQILSKGDKEAKESEREVALEGSGTAKTLEVEEEKRDLEAPKLEEMEEKKNQTSLETNEMPEVQVDPCLLVATSEHEQHIQETHEVKSKETDELQAREVSMAETIPREPSDEEQSNSSLPSREEDRSIAFDVVKMQESKSDDEVMKKNEGGEGGNDSAVETEDKMEEIKSNESEEGRKEKPRWSDADISHMEENSNDEVETPLFLDPEQQGKTEDMTDSRVHQNLMEETPDEQVWTQSTSPSTEKLINPYEDGKKEGEIEKTYLEEKQPGDCEASKKVGGTSDLIIEAKKPENQSEAIASASSSQGTENKPDYIGPEDGQILDIKEETENGELQGEKLEDPSATMEETPKSVLGNGEEIVGKVSSADPILQSPELIEKARDAEESVDLTRKEKHHSSVAEDAHLSLPRETNIEVLTGSDEGKGKYCEPEPEEDDPRKIIEIHAVQDLPAEKTGELIQARSSESPLEEHILETSSEVNKEKEEDEKKEELNAAKDVDALTTKVSISVQEMKELHEPSSPALPEPITLSELSSIDGLTKVHELNHCLTIGGEKNTNGASGNSDLPEKIENKEEKDTELIAAHSAVSFMVEVPNPDEVLSSHVEEMIPEKKGREIDEVISDKQAGAYELAETASDAVSIQETKAEDHHVTEKNEIQEVEESLLQKEQQHGDLEASKSDKCSNDQIQLQILPSEESKVTTETSGYLTDKPKEDEDMAQVLEPLTKDTEATDRDLQATEELGKAKELQAVEDSMAEIIPRESSDEEQSISLLPSREEEQLTASGAVITMQESNSDDEVMKKNEGEEGGNNSTVETENKARETKSNQSEEGRKEEPRCSIDHIEEKSNDHVETPLSLKPEQQDETEDVTDSLVHQHMLEETPDEQVWTQSTSPSTEKLINPYEDGKKEGDTEKTCLEEKQPGDFEASEKVGGTSDLMIEAKKPENQSEAIASASSSQETENKPDYIDPEEGQRLDTKEETKNGEVQGEKLEDPSTTMEEEIVGAVSSPDPIIQPPELIEEARDAEVGSREEIVDLQSRLEDITRKEKYHSCIAEHVDLSLPRETNIEVITGSDEGKEKDCGPESEEDNPKKIIEILAGQDLPAEKAGELIQARSSELPLEEHVRETSSEVRKEQEEEEKEEQDTEQYIDALTTKVGMSVQEVKELHEPSSALAEPITLSKLSSIDGPTEVHELNHCLTIGGEKNSNGISENSDHIEKIENKEEKDIELIAAHSAVSLVVEAPNPDEALSSHVEEMIPEKEGIEIDEVISDKQAKAYELAESASDAVSSQETNGEDHHVTEKNEIQQVEESLFQKEQQHGDPEPSKSDKCSNDQFQLPILPSEESKVIPTETSDNLTDKPEEDEDMAQVAQEAADRDLLSEELGKPNEEIETSLEQIQIVPKEMEEGDKEAKDSERAVALEGSHTAETLEVEEEKMDLEAPKLEGMEEKKNQTSLETTEMPEVQVDHCLSFATSEHEQHIQETNEVKRKETDELMAETIPREPSDEEQSNSLLPSREEEHLTAFGAMMGMQETKSEEEVTKKNEGEERVNDSAVETENKMEEIKSNASEEGRKEIPTCSIDHIEEKSNDEIETPLSLDPEQPFPTEKHQSETEDMTDSLVHQNVLEKTPDEQVQTQSTSLLTETLIKAHEDGKEEGEKEKRCLEEKQPGDCEAFKKVGDTADPIIEAIKPSDQSEAITSASPSQETDRKLEYPDHEEEQRLDIKEEKENGEKPDDPSAPREEKPKSVVGNGEEIVGAVSSANPILQPPELIKEARDTEVGSSEEIVDLQSRLDDITRKEKHHSYVAEDADLLLSRVTNIDVLTGSDEGKEKDCEPESEEDNPENIIEIFAGQDLPAEKAGELIQARSSELPLEEEVRETSSEVKEQEDETKEEQDATQDVDALTTKVSMSVQDMKELHEPSSSELPEPITLSELSSIDGLTKVHELNHCLTIGEKKNTNSTSESSDHISLQEEGKQIDKDNKQTDNIIASTGDIPKEEKLYGEEEDIVAKPSMPTKADEVLAGKEIGQCNLDDRKRDDEEIKEIKQELQKTELEPSYNLDIEEQETEPSQKGEGPKEITDDVQKLEKTVPAILEESLPQKMVAEKLQISEGEAVGAVNTRDLSSEVKETEHVEQINEKLAETPKSMEPSRNSLSDLLQNVTKVKETKSREEEMQQSHIEDTEASHIEEAKMKDEKSKEEAGSEQKEDKTNPESVVMVEARDLKVKTPHKKSHGILSEVGSKVKHSISKVKKAIIGKSSHTKPISPK